MVKVLFDVDTGDGPLPPLDKESLWAEKLNSTTAILRNVPFFACGVALGDVVEVVEVDNGVYRFIRVVKPTSACTVHAFVYSESDRKKLIDDCIGLGGFVETGPLENYLAINLPSLEVVSKFAEIIQIYRRGGMGDFQVSCSRYESVLPSDV